MTWEDQYISIRDEQFVCWDERGESFAVETTLEAARQAVRNHVEELNLERSCRG